MKINSRALSSTGKSIEVIQHEGISVKGDSAVDMADTDVVSTEFADAGLYVVTDETTGDSGIVAVINTAGTLSAVKLAGPTVLTIAVDTASSVNAYILAGVLAVQNLTGGVITVNVKAYV
tara:strand:+ start:10567 stop:10926 length:360 start_codon:yes stop_codon:yes gene_type:complete